MSRIQRLREYSGKPRGLQGEGRSEKNLEGWSARASDNSEIAPRASDGAMDLPSTTNRQMGLRSTKSAPRTSAEIDAHMRGKDDLNHVGSSGYMAGIRRDG
jgi:hypothetical protein